MKIRQFPCVQTDRERETDGHDEVNCRYLQFCRPRPKVFYPPESQNCGSHITSVGVQHSPTFITSEFHF